MERHTLISRAYPELALIQAIKCILVEMINVDTICNDFIFKPPQLRFDSSLLQQYSTIIYSYGLDLGLHKNIYIAQTLFFLADWFSLQMISRLDISHGHFLNINMKGINCYFIMFCPTKGNVRLC